MKSHVLMEELRKVIQSKTIFEGAIQSAGAFSRNRGMSYGEAVGFMLDMRKTSIQTRLNIHYEKKEEEPISQQAYSKIRMKFDHSPFEKMYEALVKKEYSGEYELPRWEGYHIFGIDGTELQLPREAKMREEYGVRGRGGTCPMAGMSVLYDVLHGWSLDPRLGRADMNEREESAGHIEYLCEKLPEIAKKSIVTMDRGYPSQEMLLRLDKSGLRYVVRCPSQFLAEINNAPMGDSTVGLADGTRVRIVKFTLDSGEIEILATNLFELPVHLFAELYHLRWGIESAYFTLKRELCVEKFSGKSPNSIRQDFWASMVLINSVAVFQQDADLEVNSRHISKSLKHSYRARTSHLIITLRDKFVFAVLSGLLDFSERDIHRIISTIAREVSPIRPGRSFPRNFKPDFIANHNLKSHL
jgi:hypothetical protein